MPTAVHEGQNAASGNRQPLADTNAKTIAPGNTIEVSFDHADVMACGAPRPKRIQASLVELSGMPTVISETNLERRQRERRQRQRIPFICPGIQAYLPFMDEEYWSDTPDKHVKIYDPHEWAQLKD